MREPRKGELVGYKQKHVFSQNNPEALRGSETGQSGSGTRRAVSKGEKTETGKKHKGREEMKSAKPVMTDRTRFPQESAFPVTLLQSCHSGQATAEMAPGLESLLPQSSAPTWQLTTISVTPVLGFPTCSSNLSSHHT